MATGSQIWVPKLEVVIWLRTLSLTLQRSGVGHATSSGRSLSCFVWSQSVSLYFEVLVQQRPWCSFFVWHCCLLPSRTQYGHERLFDNTHFLFNQSVNNLSIGDAGPDIERYESFIQELSRGFKRINRLRFEKIVPECEFRDEPLFRGGCRIRKAMGGNLMSKAGLLESNRSH